MPPVRLISSPSHLVALAIFQIGFFVARCSRWTQWATSACCTVSIVLTAPDPTHVWSGTGWVTLYGTTELGGAYPCYFGTLFKVGMTGGFSVLHSFTGGADGGSPQAGLTQDAAGNLYGAVPYDGASGFGARSSS